MNNEGIAPNAKRLLWAGFMAILATGVGFAVRGGVLGQWSKEFGFTMTELGEITGGGLAGFGIIIIITSFIADKIGYGKLLVLAFALHLISALVTLATPFAFASGGKPAAYWCLFLGMLIFSFGNGVCEAVVNPLTATLFPKNKTHYLNILHAGWPAGLVLGSLAAAFMVDVDWKIKMSLFLIPVVIYGLMVLGQKFPESEVSQAGISIGGMVQALIAPLFIVLLFTHALVGYVELGTDSWITNITDSILIGDSDTKSVISGGLMLMVYTSSLMFALRFVAGPIVHKISPLGLLFFSTILGVSGLTLLSRAEGVAMCVIAATVYACGKTFLWPTMLAIASERFPRAGALAIGLMGGVGMLSAGLIGAPAIGYKQDYYASKKLESESKEIYDRYSAKDEHGLFFGLVPAIRGLDGAKVGVLKDNGAALTEELRILKESNREDKNAEALNEWWQGAKETAVADKPPVLGAALFGGRSALQVTAIVPAIMGLIYLLLILYFKATGGYKAMHVDEGEMTGGVQGPMEA